MNKLASVDRNTIVVRTDQLLTSELDGETVLLNLERAAYYGLDSTAQRIWNLIAQPCRVADLCELLTAEYSVEPSTCIQQVCVFLNELNKEGLIRIVAEAGS